MGAFASVLLDALCGAAFAAAMAVVFTAPPRHVAPSFVSGLAAVLVRELLADGGMNAGGATIFASAVAVFAAVAVSPRHTVIPVVLIAAVMPLGAGAAVFHTIFELLRIASAQGPTLDDASMKLMANLGSAFTTLVAIAVGLQIGIALVGPAVARYQRVGRGIRSVNTRRMRSHE